MNMFVLWYGRKVVAVRWCRWRRSPARARGACCWWRAAPATTTTSCPASSQITYSPQYSSLIYTRGTNIFCEVHILIIFVPCEFTYLARYISNLAKWYLIFIVGSLNKNCIDEFVIYHMLDTFVV